MKCKFKVGDKVISNHPKRYVVTHKGWIGEVTGVYDNGNFSARGDEGIDFKGLRPEFFDLYKARKEDKVEYKVGDRVIAYGNIPGYENKPGTIVFINQNYRNPYCVKYDHRGDRIWSRIVSRIEDVQKIVITVDGKTTLARLYKDSKVVKSAEARCCPEDTFDFKVGANLAYQRLMDVYVVEEVPIPVEPVEPPKPKYYNGKVVCVKSGYPEYWTPGKVYEIVDGDAVDNTGVKRYFTFTNVEQTRHMGSNRNEFIPLVED